MPKRLRRPRSSWLAEKNYCQVVDIHAGLATHAEMKTSHASFRIDLLDRLVFMVRRLERPPLLFQSDTEPIGPREEVISAEDRLIDEL